MRTRKLAVWAISAAVLVAVSGRAWGQTALGTGFTYQGQLLFQNTSVSGATDFEFRLFDAALSGNQVGPTLQAPGLVLVNGRFAVQLDFGAGAFQGDARWVEVSVRTDAAGAFVTLLPRQPISATPYASLAAERPAGARRGLKVRKDQWARPGLRVCQGRQVRRAAKACPVMLVQWDLPGRRE